jgi:hypothetical protein
MEYTGTISERQGVVRYWNLRDEVTQVQETWVIVDPYYDPIDIAEGVQVTVDLRGLPVATGQLISRKELDLEELERRIPRAIIGTDPVKSFLLSLDQGGGKPFVPEVELRGSGRRAPPVAVREVPQSSGPASSLAARARSPIREAAARGRAGLAASVG